MEEQEEGNVSPLARREDESEVAHRALLLYAMQTPSRRNKRATARAIGKANSTMHSYTKKHEWDDRIVGVTIDAEAQQLYRQLYFDRVGMKEIAMIEDNIVSPITVVGNTTRPVSDTIKRTIESTKPKEKSTVFEEELKRKHLSLVDAGIGYIAQGLKTGDLRRSLKDLPMLLALRREITGDGKDESGAGQFTMIESARVRYAKSVGGDLVQAMYEDAQEMCAILGALSTKDVPLYDQIKPVREENK